MKSIIQLSFVLCCFLNFKTGISQSSKSLSQQAVATAMRIWPDSFLIGADTYAKWRYDQGVILKGVDEVWLASGNRTYFNYIQKSMDFFVSNEGAIKGYRPDEYNLDHINNGKNLLMLYRVLGRDNYKKAADQLRAQLVSHPRTQEGGYWHKKIYPHQMWLDGLYMAQPFLAEYASLFHEDSLFTDIAKQFILMEKNARDPKTGLLYHGWDENRTQQWANKQTGVSPHFWGRSLGWFGMALVDVLDYFPVDHPNRKELIQILNRLVDAVIKVQDPKSGVWFDIPNLPNQKQNYKEASASCMLTYTIAKASRMGYVSKDKYQFAVKGYKGIQQEFVSIANNELTLKGTVSVSGLGGNPYRDGSFKYYMSEPVVNNDPKGLGAFILCAAEMEYGEHKDLAKGKKVMLDNYFNSEWRKDATGRMEKWHYVWDERDNNGYHFLGLLFKKYGAELGTLHEAPRAQNLKGSDVYIIVDPDTERETAKPNYIGKEDIQQIKEWVKNGGTLILLGNDSVNAEFLHFNQLSKEFGIVFDQVLFNTVPKDQFDLGAVYTDGKDQIFGKPKKLFIKELSTLTLSVPAIPKTDKGGKVIVAVSTYGKGRVFALGDPWIYNEYIDGRRLPADFENYPAAENWVRWLLGVPVVD